MDEIAIPKISIIVPVHNIEEYLNQSLSSILGQSFQEFEVICYNDGSKDKSIEILNDFAKSDSRFIVLTGDKSMGQSHARNRALDITKGEYVCFVDGDDWLDSLALEKLYNNAKKNDSEMVIAAAKVYDEYKQEFVDDSYYSLNMFNDSFDNQLFTPSETIDFILDLNVAVWAKLYKKSFLEEINIKFREGFIYEDLLFFYESYLRAEKISIERTPIYIYRINRPHSTMENIGRRLLDRIDMVMATYQTLKGCKFYNEIRLKVFVWLVNDLSCRFLRVDNAYLKEFFFRVKKAFLSIDIDGIEDYIKKESYYSRLFFAIRDLSFVECLSFIFDNFEQYNKKENDFLFRYDQEITGMRKWYENERQKEVDNCDQKLDFVIKFSKSYLKSILEEQDSWYENLQHDRYALISKQYDSELQSKIEDQKRWYEFIIEDKIKEFKESYDDTKTIVEAEYAYKLEEIKSWHEELFDKRMNELIDQYRQKIQSKIDEFNNFNNAEIQKKLYQLYQEFEDEIKQKIVDIESMESNATNKILEVQLYYERERDNKISALKSWHEYENKQKINDLIRYLYNEKDVRIAELTLWLQNKFDYEISKLNYWHESKRIKVLEKINKDVVVEKETALLEQSRLLEEEKKEALLSQLQLFEQEKKEALSLQEQQFEKEKEEALILQDKLLKEEKDVELFSQAQLFEKEKEEALLSQSNWFEKEIANRISDVDKWHNNNLADKLREQKDLYEQRIYDLDGKRIIELDAQKNYYEHELSQVQFAVKFVKKFKRFKSKIKRTFFKPLYQKDKQHSRPKVSIILPVYNVEKYIRQSLDSLINQSLQEIEIICVDDGSTDKSGQICDEYSKRYKRVKVIHKNNAGTGAARNDGLRVATGECIAFVDPDDWIRLNMLERLYNLLKEKNVDIVMCTPAGFDEKNQIEKDFPYFVDGNFSKSLDNKIFSWKDISPFSYPMCVWNKLYKKELFDKHNIDFAEGLDFEDHKVIFKSLLVAEKIYFVREKLYVYRFNREGSILSDNNRRLLDHIKIFDIVENILKETDTMSFLRNDFLVYKIHNLLYYYEMIKPEHKQEYFDAMKNAVIETNLSDKEKDFLLEKYPDLKLVLSAIEN